MFPKTPLVFGKPQVIYPDNLVSSVSPAAKIAPVPPARPVAQDMDNDTFDSVSFNDFTHDFSEYDRLTGGPLYVPKAPNSKPAEEKKVEVVKEQPSFFSLFSCGCNWSCTNNDDDVLPYQKLSSR